MISANNVTYRVGKKALFEDIDIPVILVCGPKPDGLEDACEAIVTGVGRKAERMRTPEERKKLEEIGCGVPADRTGGMSRMDLVICRNMIGICKIICRRDITRGICRRRCRRIRRRVS